MTVVIAGVVFSVNVADWLSSIDPTDRNDLVRITLNQVQNILNSPYLRGCPKCVAGLELAEFLALTTKIFY